MAVTTSLRRRTVIVPIAYRSALENSLSQVASLFFTNANNSIYAWFNPNNYTVDEKTEYVAVEFLLTTANDATFVSDLPTLMTQQNVPANVVLTYYIDGITADY